MPKLIKKPLRTKNKGLKLFVRYIDERLMEFSKKINPIPTPKHIKKDIYFEALFILESFFIVSLISIDKLPNSKPIKRDLVWIGINSKQ